MSKAARAPGFPFGLQPKIILLREGTDTSQGVGQLIHNINVCEQLAGMVKTTLGPRGLDKLITTVNNRTTITNDGATIIRLLEPEEPVARTLADIALSQDAEVYLFYNCYLFICIFLRLVMEQLVFFFLLLLFLKPLNNLWKKVYLRILLSVHIAMLCN
jgi:hypothetical protein